MSDPSSVQTERRWLREPIPEPNEDPAIPPKKRRALFLVAIMVAVLGTFGGILSWIRAVPKPYFVPCWIAKYASPLVATNTAAQQDSESLLAGGYFPNAIAPAEGDGRDILTQLAALADRSPHEGVVVYLCAYAVGSDAKDVYLLPGDADPANPHARLPLAGVLQQLHDCPARHKLLVLDMLWPIADPRLGILSVDYGERIEKQVAALDDPHLLVLCSCSPGQVAMTSPELGRSVFGYYFEQGLRGDADGYNGGEVRDGRVTAAELAAMVSARVDRWAVHNRNTRQTPVLLGSGDDFELVALPHGFQQAPFPVRDVTSYPDWLAAGWKLCDAWSADGAFLTVPRLYRRMQTAVLEAERQWQAGGDADAIQSELAAELEQLQKERKKADAAVARPTPRSLAMAALDHQPDPAVAAALGELLTQFQTQTKGIAPDKLPAIKDKLSGEFQKKVEKSSALDVSLAAFRWAADCPHPSPAVIRLLDEAVGLKEPKPRFIETQLLCRLAELAGQPSGEGWPTAAVRHLLQATDDGERAVAEGETLPWLRGLLDAAAARRYEGEYLFWAHGFAPLDEADWQLRQASADFQTVLAHQRVLAAALRCRDEALAILPACAKYAESDPQYEASWLRAADDARRLADLLSPPTEDKPPSEKDLFETMEQVRQQTAAVSAGLEELRLPFSADNVARLIQQCGRDDAGPPVYCDAEAVLRTPLLSAKDRASLFEAGRQLAGRLNQETLALDQQERDDDRPTDFDDPYSPAPLQRDQARRAACRARCSFALLQLGGLKQESLAAIRTAWTAGDKGELPDRLPKNIDRLAEAFCRAWLETLPAQLAETKDLAARDRLARIVPPQLVMPGLDDPQTNPAVQLRLKRAVAHWAWLADCYEHAARDGLEPAFCTEAASQYRQLAGPQSQQYVEITGPDQLAGLTPGGPPSTCTFTWRLVNGTADDASFRVLSGDPGGLRLTLRPNVGRISNPSGSSGTDWKSVLLANEPVELKVALTPDFQPPGQGAAKGFLVEFRAGGRKFHHRVAIPAPAAADRVEILLSDNPKEPEPPLDFLQLRPLLEPQPLYLFVRNPSDKQRKIMVELELAQPVQAALTLAPKQTAKVAFEGKPPDPKAALPEVKSPLAVRALDAESQKPLAEKSVPVRIASPRQYVAVTGIRFAPNDGQKNRLDVAVAARGLPPGPPCQVDLVLSKEVIPGLLAVGGGTLHGKLPPDGKPLGLNAEQLQFAEGTAEDGLVYLTVDGVPRAFVFRTTFARQGDPTTPKEDLQPRLRIEAAPFGKPAPGFPVTVPVDHAPADATLELCLGQSTGSSFTPFQTQTFSEPRHRRLGLSPTGPGGALLVQASIGDWTVPIDATGCVGRRTLRARLLSRDGRVICTAFREVDFGDTAPAGVGFVDLPKEVSRHVPLVVTASATRSQPEIAKATFFVGKPADGKMPPDATPVEGEPADAGKLLWTAAIKLDDKAKGPTPITVEMTNAVGQSVFATATVQVTDAPAGSRIVGEVLEGTRPQAGLEVVLADDKGAVKGKATTKADGTFVFENVKPGKYTAAAVKAESQRKGSAPVTVLEGQEAHVTVELSL